MRKQLQLVMTLLAIVIIATTALAVPFPSKWVGVTDSGGNPASVTGGALNVSTSAVDPCASSSILKSSAVVSIGAAGTTELVAAVALKKVFVCGWGITIGGTNPTLQFLTGTKTTTPCDTAPANLTGQFTSSGIFQVNNPPAAQTDFTGTASGELCITLGGTTPVANGFLTYVQQ